MILFNSGRSRYKLNISSNSADILHITFDACGFQLSRFGSAIPARVDRDAVLDLERARQLREIGPAATIEPSYAAFAASSETRRSAGRNWSSRTGPLAR